MKATPPLAGLRSWCIPLTNFVISFKSASTAYFDDHPLRIKPIDRESQPLSELTFFHHVEHGLVTFTYRSLPAFVQPVRDYGDVVSDLEQGNIPTAVTAYMIGALPDVLRSRDEVEDWVPFDVLRLLSIGSGNEVGSTGLERYDGAGNWIGWSNTGDRPPYFRAREQVLEFVDRGMATLLECGLQSSFFGTSAFRVASRMFVRSGNDHLVVEERLSLLFRALECLCDEAGFPSRVSTESVVTKSEFQQLAQIANATRKGIQQIARDSGSSATREHLETLASTMTHKSGIAVSFGERVTRLLESSGLYDAKALEGLSFDLGAYGTKSWPKMLTTYRNVVMHSGFIKQDGYPSHWDPAYTLFDHLHDIVLRLLLTRLGFTAKYQPSTIKMTADFAVDWVTPGTDLAYLGYHQIA